MWTHPSFMISTLFEFLSRDILSCFQVDVFRYEISKDIYKYLVILLLKSIISNLLYVFEKWLLGLEFCEKTPRKCTNATALSVHLEWYSLFYPSEFETNQLDQRSKGNKIEIFCFLLPPSQPPNLLMSDTIFWCSLQSRISFLPIVNCLFINDWIWQTVLNGFETSKYDHE